MPESAGIGFLRRSILFDRGRAHSPVSGGNFRGVPVSSGVDVPVLRIPVKVVKVGKIIPQDWVQKSTIEQIVDRGHSHRLKKNRGSSANHGQMK